MLPDLIRAGADGTKLGDVWDIPYAAIQERARLQKAVDDFDPELFEQTTGGGGFGDAVYLPGLNIIRSIYFSVLFRARYYIRNVNEDGSEWKIEDNYAVDSLLTHKNADGTEEPLQFPWPNGWTRKFPKSIYTLSQPGTGRVRFEVHAVGFGLYPYYVCPISSPLYGTNVRTPDSERDNSGKFFIRVGDHWELDLDQSSPVEVITEQVPKDRAKVWAPQTGEYFGEHNLNDLKNAILQLRRIGLVADNNATSQASRRAATGVLFGTNIRAYGENKARVGNGEYSPSQYADDKIPAQVKDAYSYQTKYANGQIIGVWAYVANFGNPGVGAPNDFRYYAEGGRDSVTYGFSSFVVSGITSLQTKTTVYILPGKYPENGYFQNIFDTFGQGWIEGGWNKVGDRTSVFPVTSFLDPNPIEFGFVGPTAPDFPPDPPKGKVSFRGWVVDAAFIVFDFTDQFTYN